MKAEDLEEVIKYLEDAKDHHYAKCFEGGVEFPGDHVISVKLSIADIAKLIYFLKSVKTDERIN